MSTEKKSPAKLIIRIALGLVLAVVLVLGLLDYRAKSSATKTARAWQALPQDVVVESDLEPLIVGSPEVVTTEGNGFFQTVNYTWPGILRDYRVEVEVAGLEGQDRYVESVTGPIND